jgi:hypothetical protein
MEGETMNGKVKKVITVAALALLFSGSVFALGGGTTNADFLKIGVGARPEAMGGAYAGIADDANSAYWNPAGLAAVDKYSVTAMHLIWFVNTIYDYLSFVAPIDSMTNIGASVNVLYVPSYNSTGGIFEEEAAPASYDLAVTLSVARNLGNLYTTDFTIGNISLGGNFTYITRSLLGEALAPTISADLGIIANVTETIKLALVLQDMGTSLGDDPSPFSVRLGSGFDLAFSPEFGVLVSADVSKPIDLSNPDYQKWLFGTGVELRFFGYGFLRGGYKFGDDNAGYTAGAGIAVPDIGSIDYAFVPHTELGYTHRISLSLEFGNAVPRPSVGAPKPPQRVVAVSGDRIVSLGWEPNREANIKGYNIYYKETSLDRYKKLNAEPIMEEAKFKAVLNNNVKYDFVVTAINNRKLESVYSDRVSAMPQKYEAKKPSKIEGVFAKADEKTIIVSWDEAKEDFVVGYNLYYRKSGDAKYKLLNKKILREAKATLAGLASDVLYEFMVTAVGRDGVESEYSETVNAQTKGGDEYY